MVQFGHEFGRGDFWQRHKIHPAGVDIQKIHGQFFSGFAAYDSREEGDLVCRDNYARQDKLGNAQSGSGVG